MIKSLLPVKCIECGAQIPWLSPSFAMKKIGFLFFRYPFRIVCPSCDTSLEVGYRKIHWIAYSLFAFGALTLAIGSVAAGLRNSHFVYGAVFYMLVSIGVIYYSILKIPMRVSLWKKRSITAFILKGLGIGTLLILGLIFLFERYFTLSHSINSTQVSAKFLPPELSQSIKLIEGKGFWWQGISAYLIFHAKKSELERFLSTFKELEPSECQWIVKRFARQSPYPWTDKTLRCFNKETHFRSIGSMEILWDETQGVAGMRLTEG